MIRIKTMLIWLAPLLTILNYSTLFAASDIPEQLKPWVPWVLHGHEERNCTSSSDGVQTFCIWPEPLSLELDNQGGHFSQKWQMKKDGWMMLPGQLRSWPENVQINNKKALVVNKEGFPAVFVDTPGSYTIKGSFQWQSLPESVAIPTGTAIITPFIINGEKKIADITGNILWLNRKSDDITQQEQNTVHTQVYRLITDSIPVMVTSWIELQVSGQPREILLDWQPPENQIPVRLESTLPVKIGTDGQLHMQVRPGTFTVIYQSRLRGPVHSIQFQDSELGPDTEYWSFEAQNTLRVVKISGDPPTIDPSRTTIPQKWHSFPAYLVKKGQSLHFETIKRGNPEPPPNQLALHREFWLDGDGKGMTVRDQLSGTVHRQPRLEMQPPAILGRMVINNQDQLITRLQENGPAGVEVRQGRIQAMAVSRLDEVQNIPSGGWGQSIQKLSAELILPPGWKLLHITGVDSAVTWLSRWTLLDCFIVLIIVISTFKLLGFTAGFIALIALGLSYHDNDSPRFLWLALLTCIGILRALPEARFISHIKKLKLLLLIGLVVMILPYSVEQLRFGFFPQLENVYHPYIPPLEQSLATDSADIQEQQAVPSPSAPNAGKARSKISATVGSGYQMQEQLEPRYDTKSKVQAGPGVPERKWRVIRLIWNGPVEKDLLLTPYLLSPMMNLLLAFGKVAAIFLLVFFMLDRKRKETKPPASTKSTENTHAGPAIAASLFLFLSAFSAQTAHCADYPDNELLNTLRTRLLEKQECQPHCADIDSASISLKGSEISLQIKANAYHETAIQLPQGDGVFWQKISTNASVSPAYLENKQLWLPLPKGWHSIRMDGRLNRTDLQLQLPLKPHRISFNGNDEWTVEGLDMNNVPENQLQFIKREKEDKEASFGTSTLPPLMQVERILHLGLNWRVQTIVTRLSPAGTSVFLSVPLLAGESVTNPEYLAENGLVKVRFAPNEHRKSWSSVFDMQPHITLTAPDTTEWYEIWKLNANPTWHVDVKGIPPILHHGKAGLWQPEWRPWANETLSLEITRPEGVEGPTKAIENSTLSISPGLRSTSMQLMFTIRSTRGDQQHVSLPVNAIIQSLRINGREQPIKNDREVVIPLTPGSQKVELHWRTPDGITSLFKVPQIDLGNESVNGNIEIKLGNRWILFVRGPQVGPAILFYSELLIILIGSILLGSMKLSPLKSYHWFILGFGLCQSGLIPCLIIVAWFVALKVRMEKGPELSGAWFNLMQIALVGITLITIGALIFAIRNGLLGHPDMLIQGNGSSSYLLRWYQDRITESTLPQPMVISIPMLAYRITMLSWALWLAFHLLKWIKWGWQCFTFEKGWVADGFRIRKKKPAKEELKTAKEK